jgi:hypothetical protein
VNATLHDPETDELLAEIVCSMAGFSSRGVRAWRSGFTIVEEHTYLERGMVTIKLDDGRIGQAIVKSLTFRSDQLRRSGTLVVSGALE